MSVDTSDSLTDSLSSVSGETKQSPAVAVRAAAASNSLESDLLGLSLSSTPATSNTAPASNSSANDLFGLQCEYDVFVSASPLPTAATADTFTAESSSSVPAPASTAGDGKMSVDSIMALFGPKSSPAPAVAQTFPPLQQAGGFPGQAQVPQGMFGQLPPQQLQYGQPAPQPGQLPQVQPSAFNNFPNMNAAVPQQNSESYYIMIYFNHSITFSDLFSDLYKPQQTNNNKEMTNNPFLDSNQVAKYYLTLTV